MLSNLIQSQKAMCRQCQGYAESKSSSFLQEYGLLSIMFSACKLTAFITCKAIFELPDLLHRHVMPDAYEALSKSMQGERGQLTGGSTVLLGIFAMVLIESMVSGRGVET